MNGMRRPFYHGGVYHFFFQYNPHSPMFGTGRLSWGHSVSGDLVNWAFVGTALDPTSPFDADGCWSGSATVLPDGRVAILYTGRDTDTVQVQNVAFPKDPTDLLLREWHKPECNPVIPQPPDVTGNNFRDPSTAWLAGDGLWRFAVTAELAGGVGATLVYRSSDFLRWERNAAPLHTSPEVPVLECADMFPVAEHGEEGLDTSAASGPGVRHVLKLSKMSDEDYYMVGSYDDVADTFVPAEEERGSDVTNWRRLDHGHLFGAKSFFDARKKRRVLWAWVDETDRDSDEFAKGWAGIQAFPRALWLDTDGKKLVQWPIEEIEQLRRKHVALLGAEVAASGGLQEIAGVDSRQADVEVVFEVPDLEAAEEFDPKWLQDPQKLTCAEKNGGVGPFGLIAMASGDGDSLEQSIVSFRIFKHHDGYKVVMCMDLTRSSTTKGVSKPVYAGLVDVDVEKDRRISLRTLTDHSVIESFGGGGRACITARVYPEHVAGAGSSRLYLFNNGSDPVKVSKLDAWELGTASVNLEDVVPGLSHVVSE
ncbi:hypothetical protein HU200_006680 [Digitaria exilis]|uniref:Uncharacterized protein n=1 Tax=Digitaria exilis TaxID=1010633 RepID=A0A835FRE6_9POAL|nr:hypothetical protein HU200_006680 [Digitaria exilis]